MSCFSIVFYSFYFIRFYKTEYPGTLFSYDCFSKRKDPGVAALEPTTEVAVLLLPVPT
jgi:hypothetical protein